MIRVFPVSGGARFTDDWGDGRSGGRTHKGNDLFNEEDTPLLAVDDGELRFGTDPLGGNVATVTSGDNTRYYYAHLSAFEGAAPRSVSAGDVIGYLGHTGNAVGTPNHLHFEIHPNRDRTQAFDPFEQLSAAPVMTAGAEAPSSGGGRKISPVVVVLTAGALAAGIWAIMNPAGAKRLVRSF